MCWVSGAGHTHIRRGARHCLQAGKNLYEGWVLGWAEYTSQSLIEVIESNSITPISSISPIDILLVTQSAQSAQSPESTLITMWSCDLGDQTITHTTLHSTEGEGEWAEGGWCQGRCTLTSSPFYAISSRNE